MPYAYKGDQKVAQLAGDPVAIGPGKYKCTTTADFETPIHMNDLIKIVDIDSATGPVQKQGKVGQLLPSEKWFEFQES